MTTKLAQYAEYACWGLMLITLFVPVFLGAYVLYVKIIGS